MFRNRIFLTACLVTGLFNPAYADHSSIGFGTQGAGPINTIQAATLPRGAFTLGLTSEYARFDSFSDDALTTLAGAHVHAHSADYLLTTFFGVSYGLSDNFTFGIQAPYVHRENVRAGAHAHVGGVAVNGVDDFGDSSGAGDITALGKYRFWNRDGRQAALLFGAKLPTGKTNVSYRGQRLEAEHQPGSGSWDGLAGFAAGVQAGSVSFDASALYVLTTEGTQDTDLGDRLRYNLAASYRIGGEAHDHGDSIHRHKAFDLVLELNGEWANQKKTAGSSDNDSGGNEVFLAPGMRYAPNEKWAGHLSVGVPVISNLGRGHAETDFKITTGITKSF